MRKNIHLKIIRRCFHANFFLVYRTTVLKNKILFLMHFPWVTHLDTPAINYRDKRKEKRNVASNGCQLSQ